MAKSIKYEVMKYLSSTASYEHFSMTVLTVETSDTSRLIKYSVSTFSNRVLNIHSPFSLLFPHMLSIFKFNNDPSQTTPCDHDAPSLFPSITSSFSLGIGTRFSGATLDLAMIRLTLARSLSAAISLK
ncbi:hypothetical protein M513_13146, partial [Trichuris suis]